MYKLIKTAPKLFLFLAISMNCLSQTETHDIITYTVPKDWIKNTKEGLVMYTTVNATTGGFCMIAFYVSSKSTGDAQKDFNNEWKELVVTPYKADADPQTQTQSTPDGWNAVVGAAQVKTDDIDSYVFLTVFSGFGKTTSVLVNLNDQAYLVQVDSLLDNIKLDKTASKPVETNQPNTAGSSIIGVWNNNSVTIGDYVSPSGAFLKSADISTMEEYDFRANNTYKKRFFGMVHGVAYYTETTGTYKVNANKITLTPLERHGGYGGSFRDEKHMLGKPETFEFYIGPNKWKPGPFLNLHQDGKYYMWSDFPYDYYEKVSK